MQHLTTEQKKIATNFAGLNDEGRRDFIKHLELLGISRITVDGHWGYQTLAKEGPCWVISSRRAYFADAQSN